MPGYKNMSEKFFNLKKKTNMTGMQFTFGNRKIIFTKRKMDKW